MRKVVTISAMLLVLGASLASAEQGEFLLGGVAGMGVPTGDFGDLADPGFAGGVFGDYMVTPNFAVGVDALFHSFGGSDELVEALDALTSSQVDDASFQLLQFTGHGRWVFTPEQQVMPYVVGGGGIYNVTAKVEGPEGEADESESKAGIFGGAGLEFKASPMFRVGVEGALHNVFTEGESSQVFTVLGRVSFSFAAQTQ